MPQQPNWLLRHIYVFNSLPKVESVLHLLDWCIPDSEAYIPDSERDIQVRIAGGFRRMSSGHLPEEE